MKIAMLILLLSGGAGDEDWKRTPPHESWNQTSPELPKSGA